jgi:hypothetical protein
MRHSRGIYLERIRGTTQTLRQNSMWPSQDSSRVRTKYKSRALFLKHFCSWPHFELHLSLWPLTLHRCYYLSLYFHIVHLYILEYSYIAFIYNTILFLNILFRRDTLFTYRSKNILLIIGIVLSMFRRPNEHFQVFECPAAVWSNRISPVFKNQDDYLPLTANKSRDGNHIQPDKMWEKP